MKRTLLLLAGLATLASADNRLRLYGEAREVTTIPAFSNLTGEDPQTNIGVSGGLGIQAPLSREAVFDAHTAFILSRWGESDAMGEAKVASYFQSIGLGIQFQPTRQFGLHLGFAYDIALDNDYSYTVKSGTMGMSSSSNSMKTKNVPVAEIGVALKIARRVDVVGDYRLPLGEYNNDGGSGKIKLHQVNIGLRYNFNSRNSIEGVE